MRNILPKKVMGVLKKFIRHIPMIFVLFAILTPGFIVFVSAKVHSTVLVIFETRVEFSMTTAEGPILSFFAYYFTQFSNIPFLGNRDEQSNNVHFLADSSGIPYFSIPNNATDFISLGVYVAFLFVLFLSIFLYFRKHYFTSMISFIGVASLVALVSIGQGSQTQITSRLSGLGADMITISTGFSRAGDQGFRFGGDPRVGGIGSVNNLTENDARIVKTIPGVMYVNGIVSGRGEVSFFGQTASVSIQGVDTSVWKLMELSFDSGIRMSCFRPVRGTVAHDRICKASRPAINRIA